jgi:hypothetical protein
MDLSQQYGNYMSNPKPKVRQLKNLDKLIGQILPGTNGGASGRGLEKLITEVLHIPIDRGAGPDIRVYDLEVKSRDVDSDADHTIGTMTTSSILASDYDQTHIKDKLQQQLRVKTKDNVIVEADIYDFSRRDIQDQIRSAYESARRELTELFNIHGGKFEDYLRIHGGQFGGFEYKNNGSFAFRISDAGMKKLETSAKSMFGTMFEYGV